MSVTFVFALAITFAFDIAHPELLVDVSAVKKVKCLDGSCPSPRPVVFGVYTGRPSRLSGSLSIPSEHLINLSGNSQNPCIAKLHSRARDLFGAMLSQLSTIAATA